MLKLAAPILWPLDAKNWLIAKDPNAGKDWRREEKGLTEDEMAEQHHQLNGHEFEQTLGDGEEEGRLLVLQSVGSQRAALNLATEQVEEMTWDDPFHLPNVQTGFLEETECHTYPEHFPEKPAVFCHEGNAHRVGSFNGVCSNFYWPYLILALHLTTTSRVQLEERKFKTTNVTERS